MSPRRAPIASLLLLLCASASPFGLKPANCARDFKGQQVSAVVAANGEPYESRQSIKRSLTQEHLKLAQLRHQFDHHENLTDPNGVASDANQQLQPQGNATDEQEADKINRNSVVESLFGQVAKTVIYGGATLARFNSRLLCPLLSHETERDNDDQPTLFVFNNPNKNEHAFRIYADDDITADLVQEAQFDATQMTVLFIHGWLGGIQNELWLSEARNVALQLRNNLRAGANSTGQYFRPNVIVVDWSEFAQGSLYTATQNSLKVSRRLGRLLEQLAMVGGLKPELMHCLGHSIGTHICGQAARYAFPVAPRHTMATRTRQLPKRRFGRITALDPGGFCYELGVRNETKYRGLRPSDALLVDAYYSNRSPFGNKYQVAHYNVRLSNGFLQQPCSVWRNSEVASEYFRAAVRFVLGNVGHNDILTCDHYFATRFAHQSPQVGCSYTAYACDSYRNYLKGRCGQCQAPNQCYSMDFEYQRQRPSVAHALRHLSDHSSYLMGTKELDSQIGQPPGGVPYENRRVFYLQIAHQEPYCSSTFRVKVKLNQSSVDVSSFRSEWLRLRFLLGASSDEVTQIQDAHLGAVADSLRLHGPWEPLYDRAQQAEELSGLDSRTLTGMFELAPVGRLEPITGAIVMYDSDTSTAAEVNPVETIEIEYLSSSDRKTRSQYSRTFRSHQFVVYQSRGFNEDSASLATV